MGCGCRGGVRRSSPRSFISPPITPPSTRSLCALLESEGNNTTVRVGSDGRLYLGDLPAPTALSGAGCRGNFAQAVLAAGLKLSSVFLSAPARLRFQGLVPVPQVKLGHLRDILRGF